MPQKQLENTITGNQVLNPEAFTVTIAQVAGPCKVPMELWKKCRWYLVMAGTEFGIQYYGDEPDDDFPPGLDGMCIRRSGC
jgi:hypothetical protein